MRIEIIAFALNGRPQDTDQSVEAADLFYDVSFAGHQNILPQNMPLSYTDYFEPKPLRTRRQGNALKTGHQFSFL